MGKVNIETKKDTAAKEAVVKLKGNEYFILAEEFNALVKALNENYDAFSEFAQNVSTSHDLKAELDQRIKTIYSALTGHENGGLEGLSTENKQNLVVAINELHNLVKAMNVSEVIGDELETSDTKTYSIDALKNYVSAELKKIIANAPDALNTLEKIATELQENKSNLNALVTAQVKRLRVDGTQNFTESEKTQGQQNLGVHSKKFLDEKLDELQTEINQLKNKKDMVTERITYTEKTESIVKEIGTGDFGNAIDATAGNVIINTSPSMASVQAGAGSVVRFKPFAVDTNAERVVIGDSSFVMGSPSGIEKRVKVEGVTSFVKKFNANETMIITQQDLTQAQSNGRLVLEYNLENAASDLELFTINVSETTSIEKHGLAVILADVENRLSYQYLDENLGEMGRPDGVSIITTEENLTTEAVSESIPFSPNPVPKDGGNVI